LRFFSTFCNSEILTHVHSIFPDVELIEDDHYIHDTDLLLLVAKTSKFGTDISKLRSYLNDFKEIPAIVIVSDGYAPGRELIAYAKERIPEENILIPVNRLISLDAIVGAINRTVFAGEFMIDLDVPSISKRSIDKTKGMESKLVINPDSVRSLEISEEGVDTATPLNSIRPVRQFHLPSNFVAIYGIKGGVGTSTVAAMMIGTMNNAVHIEVTGPGGMPSAWMYYGDLARTHGVYAWWDCSMPLPDVPGLPVFDISHSVPVNIVDEMVARAACFILVVDRSETAFGLAKDMFAKGFSCDLFVVNSTFMGIGNTVDVYKNDEFSGLLPDDLIDIPGGLDVENVVLKAQRDHVSPVSVAGAEDLAMAAGEIVSMVRKRMAT